MTEHDQIPAPTPPTPRPGPEDAPLLVPPLVRVAFSDADEFVREVRLRGPNLEPVLRATLQWVRGPEGAPFYDLYVLATYLRRIAPGVVALTELRHYAGVVWVESDDERPQRVEELARRLLGAVEHAARKAGVVVARGAYLAPARAGRPPRGGGAARGALARPRASDSPPAAGPGAPGQSEAEPWS
jgi:hypothetical protein